MDELELELKTGFLDEAYQLLSDTERCFLDLENNSQDPSTLENIFRLAHNLKGSARAVGFLEMGEFTHLLESFLLKLKTGEIKVGTSIVSLLLNCADHLKVWIETLKSNMQAHMDSSEIAQRIQQHLDGNVSDIPSTPTAAPTSPEPVAPVETPVSGGYDNSALFAELEALVGESLATSAPAAPPKIVEAVAAPAPLTPSAPKAASNSTPDESIREGSSFRIGSGGSGSNVSPLASAIGFKNSAIAVCRAWTLPLL